MERGISQLHPETVEDNVFKLIGKDWMLITAGTSESFNTMTASWGGMGVLWDKKVSFVFVRPTRFTFEFLEKFILRNDPEFLTSSKSMAAE